MSLITKGKLDVTDDVSKAVYRKFKQVRRVYTMFFGQHETVGTKRHHSGGSAKSVNICKLLYSPIFSKLVYILLVITQLCS